MHSATDWSRLKTLPIDRLWSGKLCQHNEQSYGIIRGKWVTYWPEVMLTICVDYDDDDVMDYDAVSATPGLSGEYWVQESIAIITFLQIRQTHEHWCKYLAGITDRLQFLSSDRSLVVRVGRNTNWKCKQMAVMYGSLNSRFDHLRPSRLTSRAKTKPQATTNSVSSVQFIWFHSKTVSW